MYRVVDDVMDNLDLRMTAIHAGKIGVARELCPSFYEGFGGAATAAATVATSTSGAASPSTEIDAASDTDSDSDDPV
jgi:hypothetical protein